MEELIDYYKKMYRFDEWNTTCNNFTEMGDKHFFVRTKLLAPFQQTSRSILTPIEAGVLYTLINDVCSQKHENSCYRIRVTPFRTEETAKNGLLRRLLSPVPFVRDDKFTERSICFISTTDMWQSLAFMSRHVVVQIIPLSEKYHKDELYMLARLIEQQIYEA